MSYESPATQVEHELRVELVRPRSRSRLWAGIAVAVLILAALGIPAIRWRAELVGLQSVGKIPDMRLFELLRLIAPGANQPHISGLLANRNPYAVVRIPRRDARDIAAGAKLFQTQCASCHGADANGGPGAPPLLQTEFKHGDSEWALYRTIRYGVPRTAMMPHPLGWSQLWQIVAYIRSLGVGADEDVSISPELQRRLSDLRVPYSEQAAIAEPATDWLNFSGSYAATRHSALTQITRENVRQLALRWTVQLDDTAQKIEASALAREGILLITVPPAKVMALDAANGHLLWIHQHPYERKGGGEGPIGQNRGVAVLDDRVYVGTWDAKLSALDIANGKLVWETTVDPQYPSTYISAAPLVYKDLVVVGMGTAPSESRGFIAAFDAHTGKERWRFNVIPDPGQPGHETWTGDSWRVGGAGPWMTGSYDPRTDTLYWGVGGPKPDFDPGSRKGDNLYSNSVVALRGSTGQLLWYFQFTPGDTHDWDSTQVPMLVDRNGPEGREKRLLWANRNGFFYILNRETGQFLKGVPFVHQNWSQGLDPLGRPIRSDTALDQTQGWQVYPGAKGGTNWWPPSYDPALNLVFIPVLEQGMVFFPTAQTLPSTSGRSFYTAIRALDASTGKLVWEHKQAPRLIDNDTGGLLSTRGGVVFGSDQSRFFALDARTGRLLWSVETGGTIMAAPTTYTVHGEQMITVAAGRNLMTFALPSSQGVQED